MECAIELVANRGLLVHELAALFMEEVLPMGFMKTKRSDGFEGHRRSFITVTESHFHLNAKFMREADL